MILTSHDQAGDALREVEALRGDVLEVFAAAGFAHCEPGVLLEAEHLLDLYGEDVRARAFVFAGEGKQELCLRPDLTLPLCRAYLSRQTPREQRLVARGAVFRRPAEGDTRHVQFEQIGCEWYGDQDAAQADAAIFALTREALQRAGVGEIAVTTGDLGLIFSLIDAAPMPQRWRARLKRHIWRPDRFHALLSEMTREDTGDEGRTAFLKALGALDPAQARAAVERMLNLSETTHVGLRSPEEIASRFLGQAKDAQAHPMPGEIAAAIETATALKTDSADALRQMRELSAATGLDLSDALTRFERRLAALEGHGIAASALPFDAEFGRNLEYYDGFVFEFFDAERAIQSGRRAAQLGGGGRYDRLLPAAARAFGLPEPAAPSAVGAAIRPESLLLSIGGEA